MGGRLRAVPTTVCSLDKGTGVCAFLLGLTLAVFPQVRGQYRFLRKWPVVDDEPKPLDR